jgi:hypothetical protein
MARASIQDAKIHTSRANTRPTRFRCIRRTTPTTQRAVATPSPIETSLVKALQARAARSEPRSRHAARVPGDAAPLLPDERAADSFGERKLTHQLYGIARVLASSRQSATRQIRRSASAWKTFLVDGARCNTTAAA